MITLLNKYLKTVVVVLWISTLSIGFWGCTNIHDQGELNGNYLPKEGVVVKVDKVVNDTGFTFDFDIEKMLSDALEDQLFEKDLLWLGDKEPNLFMESTIISSSSKQPLTPIVGPNELSIRCELKDNKDNLVGSFIVRRELAIEDLKTVEGQQTIIKSVANDVAEDIRSRFKAYGYIVRPKTLPKETADKAIASFSPAKVDPTQPWTGVWDVQGSVHCSGRWRMIQTGNHVGSTKDSVYEIKGKAKGNQLKGTMSSSTSSSQFNSFVINISPNGLLFEGTCDLPWQKNLPIKGKRTTESTVITFSSYQIDPTEPWAGTWRVEGNIDISGIWRLKQSGKVVKSTKDSAWKFKGNVEGNQLKGQVIGDYGYRFKTVIEISSDGQSFKGSAWPTVGARGGLITGSRE